MTFKMFKDCAPVGQSICQPWFGACPGGMDRVLSFACLAPAGDMTSQRDPLVNVYIAMGNHHF